MYYNKYNCFVNFREKQYSMKLALQKEREVSVCKARMNSGRRRKLNLTIQEATDVCILDREVHVHVL